MALQFSHQPLIMGIVNVTPDSFSGDGLIRGNDYVAAATKQALQMLDDGADCLDIGGESSRPGATPISAAEEIRRTIPVIEAIRKACGATPPIAIDTIKAEVAAAALDAGADIVNDISALQNDVTMAGLIAKRSCCIVLMHNRSEAAQFNKDTKLGGEYQAAVYDDVVEDVKSVLAKSVAFAIGNGVSPDKIIIDPGIGFGKNVQQNMQLIQHIPRLKEIGCPVLIGPSRKNFIGKVLDLPVDDRLEGTAATIAISAFLGADIVRVHDVKYMARVAKMAAAIRGS